MAKDTSTSGCPEVASVCEKTFYGSRTELSKARTTSGFILKYDVDCIGYRLSNDQIDKLGRYLSVCLKKVLDSIASDAALKDIQIELDF